jgi:hypothetical protein
MSKKPEPDCCPIQPYQRAEYKRCDVCEKFCNQLGLGAGGGASRLARLPRRGRRGV